MFKNAMKYTLVGACSLFAFVATPSLSAAADFEVETVFEDALYGGAIGALVGAGAMLISSHPTSNWDYILTGAGVGIIGGAAYGVYTSSRSLAKIEDGKMVVGVPTPQIKVENYNDNTVVALQADLLKVNY